MTNTTAERLEAYYAFDDDVLARVDEVAGRQRTMGWRDFLADCGVEAPQSLLVDDRSTAYLRFTPKTDYDDSRVRVYHGSMANPLDPNIAYHAATVFAADPTVPMIVTANPSGPGRSANVLNRADRQKVAAGELLPVVEPLLRKLADDGIKKVEHIGTSYGSEKGMVSALHAPAYDHEVSRVIAIDPPSVIGRGLGKLAVDFMSTNKHLARYVEASNSPALDEARAESVSAVAYAAGLLRLSNIAVARALAKDGFRERADGALAANPDMRSLIAWGSASELALDGPMAEMVGKLRQRFGDRVSGLRLPGQSHAFMNDVHLQAAVTLQGYKA